jgi:hypothetical protein
MDVFPANLAVFLLICFSYVNNYKVKVVPFLNALGGGDWPASRLGHFSSGEGAPGTH